MKILILGAYGLTEDERKIVEQYPYLFIAIEEMDMFTKEITSCLVTHEDFALWLNHAQADMYVIKTLAFAREQGADPVIIYSGLRKEAKETMLRICTEEGWEFLTFEDFCKKYLTEDA